MVAHKRTIQPGGTRGTVFKAAARARLEDAGVLLREKRYAGAIYLAGYAVECLLKWAITRRQQRLHLPAEFEIHSLDRLLLEAGLAEALHRETAVRDTFAALADSWGPELRYLARAPEPREADQLYGDTSRVYVWITEQTI
jgi:HEPN domain-containing protein